MEGVDDLYLLDVDDSVDPGETLNRIACIIVDLLAHGSVKTSRQIDGFVFHQQRLRPLFCDAILSPEFAGLELVKMISVLNIVSEKLEKREPILLRDLYYRLKHFFVNQCACNRIVKKICTMLAVPRSSLGIYSSAKGLVFGPFQFCCDESGHTWVSANATERLIPNLAVKENAVKIRPLSSCLGSGSNKSLQRPLVIVVVEKETIFNQIIGEQLSSGMSRCIFVTGKGVPCLSTRAFVKLLSDYFNIPVVGICDFNPFGYKLMLSYVHGSIDSIEAYRYAIPSMRIIGLKRTDVMQLALPQHVWQTFTDCDAKECDRLLSMLDCSDEPLNRYDYLKNELKWMKRIGLKLELESLNCQVKHPTIKHFQSEKQVRSVIQSDKISVSYLNNVWLPEVLTKILL